MHQSIRQRITIIAIAVISLILTLQAVSKMVFASLGSTASSNSWSYVLTLQIVMAAIGVAGYFSDWAILPKIVRKISHFVLIILSGVLLGFYYGGIYIGKNPQATVTSAIAMGIIFYLLDRWQPRIAPTVAITIATVCAYGFALMRGIAAINLIAGSLFTTGIIWGCVCLVYLWLTANNLAIAFQEIR